MLITLLIILFKLILDNFNDEITIYAIELPNNKIKLTDHDWTLNNLEEHGVNIRR